MTVHAATGGAKCSLSYSTSPAVHGTSRATESSLIDSRARVMRSQPGQGRNHFTKDALHFGCSVDH